MIIFREHIKNWEHSASSGLGKLSRALFVVPLFRANRGAELIHIYRIAINGRPLFGLIPSVRVIAIRGSEPTLVSSLYPIV